MNSIFIVIPILLVLMFSLGLELSWHDFKLFRKEPKALLVGLVGQVVLLPLVAIGLTYFLNIPFAIKAGIVLIACCPGGASSNAFSMLAKGNVPLSVSLTVISSLITLFTIPLVMMLFLQTDTSIDIPLSKLFIQNIVLVLLPLVIGMLWHQFKQQQALRIAVFLKRFTLWLLFLLVIIFFIENRKTIIDYGGELGVIITVLIVFTICLGGLLAMLFKLKRADKRTITIEIGMQNAAQAIALAASPFVFNMPEMAIPGVIYALLMNIILLLFLYVVKRKDKNVTSAKPVNDIRLHS